MTHPRTNRDGLQRFVALALLTTLLGGFAAMSVAAITVPRPAAAAQSIPADKQAEFDRREREIRQLKLKNEIISGTDKAVLTPLVNTVQGVKSYITDPLVNSFHWILTKLVALSAALMEFIIDLAGKLLNVVLRVNTYADAQIVKEGWKFVRDLLNFLFVPALLALAFSTIAGIESYEMRRWLPRIIVAALFVNFSLGIGGGINAVATAAMNLLGGGSNSNLGQTLVTNLRKAAQTERLHLEDPAARAQEASHSSPTQSSQQPQPSEENTPATSLELWKLLVAQIAQVIILTVAAIVFFLLFLLFLLRVVAIYILLILSPIGFAFSILPQLAPLAQRWWRSFLQWVIFGPAALTLVVLAARLAGQDATQGALTNVVANSQLGGIASVAFNTLMVCLFLLAALFIGREMGVAGASAIAGWGAAAAKGSAYWLSGAGAGVSAGRALWRRTGEPFMAAREEQQKAATRARREGLFGRLGRATVGTPRGRAGEQMRRRQEDEEVKDLTARGATQKDLTLSKASHARYALEKGLISGKPGTEEQGFYETALNAVPLNSEAFNRGARAYQERYVVAGTNFVTQKRTGAVATASDHEKTLQGLSDVDAFNAYTREPSLRADISAHKIRASRNLARGVANAGDVPAGQMIAYAARPGTAKENPAVIKELEDRKII